MVIGKRQLKNANAEIRSPKLRADLGIEHTSTRLLIERSVQSLIWSQSEKKILSTLHSKSFETQFFSQTMIRIFLVAV